MGSLTRRPTGRAIAFVLLLAVVGALASVLATRGQRTTWTSERQMMLRTWSVDSLVLSGQPSILSDEDRVSATTVATSYDVIDTAVRRHPDLGSSGELKRAVSASLEAGSNFITLTAKGDDRDQAEHRVQAVSEAFSQVASQRMLALADSLAKQAPSPDVRQRAQAVRSVTPVQVYRTGEPVRAGTSMAKAAGAGAVVGLALGTLGIAIWTFLADARWRRLGDSEVATRRGW